MGFSTAVLLTAVASGVLVAMAKRPVAAAAGCVGLHVVATRVSGQGFFAEAHVAYLLITVTPVVAAVGLVARRRLRVRWAWLLCIPGLVGVYATHIEPDRLVTDEVTLTADVGGLRIGVLADLQTPNIGEHERNAVRRLIDAGPDLILVPGDLWQMSDEQIVDDWPLFADLVQQLLDAVDHVVIVEGDTDHIGWLDRIGAQTGAHIAHDRVVHLDIDGVAVAVGGTELIQGAPRAGAAATLAELAAAESDDVLTIVLSHRPDVVSWLPGPVDVVVAGHTHGGQVSIPFFGPLVTLSDVPRHVAAGGLHELDGQWIYVSPGVGLERKRAPQIRFLVPPSIGVIDVVVTR